MQSEERELDAVRGEGTGCSQRRGNWMQSVKERELAA